MASSYTINSGFEKPAAGEQSGTWGGTVNTNFDLIDEAINGIITITLAAAGTSGAPNALAITDGASSDGRNVFIEFDDAADLGADVYVQLTPNTAEKVVFIRNSLTTQQLYLFQGTYNSARDLIINNSDTVIVKFSGEGASSSTVANVLQNLTVSGLSLPNAGSVKWRNAADTDNILLTIDSNDDLVFSINGTTEMTFDAGAGLWDFQNNKILTTGLFTSKGINDTATAAQLAVSDTGGAFTGTVTGSNLSGTNTGDEVAASVTVAGVVEVATQAEVDTGTDTLRSITPETLTGWAKGTQLTTKGDVLTYSTVNARLAVGADGEVLTADSAQALGVKWAAGGGGGGSTTWLGLTDTASSFSALKWVRANAGATALEFVSSPVTSVGSSGAINSTGGTTPSISIDTASTTTDGSVELATSAETNTGTDTTRAITPAGLEAWTGSAQITSVGDIKAILDTDFSSNGLMIRTADGSYASRSVIVGTTNGGILVTDGDGVSNNVTIETEHTISTSAPSGTPAKGTVWYRY